MLLRLQPHIPKTLELDVLFVAAQLTLQLLIDLPLATPPRSGALPAAAPAKCRRSSPLICPLTRNVGGCISICKAMKNVEFVKKIITQHCCNMWLWLLRNGRSMYGQLPASYRHAF